MPDDGFLSREPIDETIGFERTRCAAMMDRVVNYGTHLVATLNQSRLPKHAAPALTLTPPAVEMLDAASVLIRSGAISARRVEMRKSGFGTTARRIRRAAIVLIVVAMWGMPAAARGQDDPLLDYGDWRQYRTTVAHPTLAIKPADLQRAKENARRYPWAKDYVARVIRSAERWLQRIEADERFIESMIATTTPGDPLFTPCPACRDQQKPAHPHGQWDWAIEKPDQLTCQICKTVFPNEKYPETIALEAKWRRDEVPQTFTFHGGEPFVVFGYTRGRDGPPRFHGGTAVFGRVRRGEQQG